MIASKVWRLQQHPWHHTIIKHLTNSRIYASSSSSSSYSTNQRTPLPLYKRLSSNRIPSDSIVPILNQWVEEGRHVSRDELSSLIARFSSLKRLSHAFQISEWMSERHSSNLLTRDRAIHMELMSTVRGLGQAEMYFHDLPSTLRSPRICSTLLKCYAEAKCLKKAEILLDKMKRSDFAESRYPYNFMLKLYLGLELYDKVEPLLEEMEKKGFIPDSWTYRIQLAAYSTSGKVEEMDMVLMKMEADPAHTMTATDYITCASGYMNAGFVDKSVTMLRLAEHLAGFGDRKHIKDLVRCLITLYSRAKVKKEVFRLWDIYKSSWNVDNKGYHIMVSSLVRLDEFEAAEEMIDEWVESSAGKTSMEMRVINPLVQAYGNRGEFERAEELINKIRNILGIEPQRSTLYSLLRGYMIHDRMEDVVETVEKAFKLNDSTWKPYNGKSDFAACLDYLKMKGDSEELLKFRSLIQQSGLDEENLSSHVHGSVFMSEAQLEDIELCRTYSTNL